MALPGGPADKAGNSYETLWTLLRVADVLRGDATSIQIEPPNELLSGAEFLVRSNSGTWAEQVKSGTSQSWTIPRLKREGVLHTAKIQCAAGRKFRLVVSIPAQSFADLAELAGATAEHGVFKSVLSRALTKELRTLESAWETDTPCAWALLKQIHVEVQPVGALSAHLSLRFEGLVSGDPDVALGHLRSFLDATRHQVLTGPRIRAHLDDCGVRPALSSPHPANLAFLDASISSVKRRLELERPPGGLVAETESARLRDLIDSSVGTRVFLVHGRAGSGKSTVALAAVLNLQRENWFGGAVRLDSLESDASSAHNLGQQAGLPGSPVAVLQGVAGSQPGILLIDQLDAVSTHSGRRPNSYAAVHEVLQQAERVPGLRILLVVRSVDLAEDPRFRALRARKERVAEFEVQPLAEASIHEKLSEIGLEPGSVHPTTLSLLSVPLHFSVFRRLAEEHRHQRFVSLSDLYAQLTRDVRRSIDHEFPEFDWTSVMVDRIVRYMSDHERLSIPAVHLQPVRPVHLGALESCGLLHKHAGSFAFFHETYFDFLFASAFVAEEEDLHDFLLKAPQHLFRRSQVRQVLEFLLESDRIAFRSTAVRLLESDSIRFHVKAVVLSVLRQAIPTADDLLAVFPVFMKQTWVGRAALALLSSHAWFDVAAADGAWPKLLKEPATVDRAFHSLKIVARERGEQVGEILQPFVGKDDLWRARIRSLVSWSLSPGIVPWVESLFEAGYLDDVRSPMASNGDVWSLVSFLKHDPAAAARFAGAVLRRALARAAEVGSTDPFTSEHLSEHSATGPSTIMKLASEAPLDYVVAVLPFVLAVIDGSRSDVGSEGERRSLRWRSRHPDPPHGVDDALFSGLELALRESSASAPERIQAALDVLLHRSEEPLRFLACRLMQARSPGEEAIAWLLSNTANLRLGWNGNPLWASYELIKEGTPRCSPEALDDLCAKLLNYYPAQELAADRRKSRGYSQYQLLTAIDSTRRPETVRRRLLELARKFPDAAPGAPRGRRVAGVGSPVPDKAAPHMTDANWLTAVAQYQTTETSWKSDAPVGGADQLARSLARIADSDPERFVRLGSRFPPGTPPEYFRSLIEAVAGRVSPSAFCDLCRIAHAQTGVAVAQAICTAIAKAPESCERALIPLVVEAASDPDPATELASEDASGGHVYYGGDFYMAGVNSTRGASALAIAALISVNSELVDILLPHIKQLAADPRIAVRCCVVEALVVLFESRPEVATSLTKTLLETTPDALEGPRGVRLLWLAMNESPTLIGETLAQLLGDEGERGELAGAVWAAALDADLLTLELPLQFCDLPPSARAGAVRHELRAEQADLAVLEAAFCDPIPGVREAAADILRRIGGLDDVAAGRLVESFLRSPSAGEHCAELLRGLEESTALLPDAAVAACEKALEIGGESLGDISTHHAGMSSDLVTVILRVYSQSGGSLRERCLDVIDRLVEFSAFGLEKALESQR